MSDRDDIRDRTLITMLTAVDGLGLVDLSDDVLDLLYRRLESLSRDLEDEGEHEASAAVWALAYRFTQEESHRHSQVESARIEVEGNGHGVTIDHEKGVGWFAFCRCSDEWANPGRHGRVLATRQEAMDAAERHLEKTGGLWLGDMSQR